METYYCPGDPVFEPGWDIPGIPIAASMTDTCFDFWEYANLRALSWIKFGNADRDSFPELVGTWSYSIYFYEFSPEDSLFVVQDSIHNGAAMDYGNDSDGDGFLEFILKTDTGLVIYESADSTSLPVNHVFTWNWSHGTKRGGIFDLDGDGTPEISYRNNSMTIDVLRNVGDNNHEFAYSINVPDYLLDNYGEYIAADFDDDGVNELVTPGSLGRVVLFEYVEPDSFEYITYRTVSHYNAFYVTGPSDMDQDGLKEFVVLLPSVAAGGFFSYFFEFTGDNQFSQIYVDSLPGFTLEEGKQYYWDFDEDGIDEYVVCSVGYIGIIEATGDNQFEYVYLARDFASVIYLYDLNNNGYSDIIFDEGLYEGTVIKEYTLGIGVHGDVNTDCETTLADVLYLVNYFKGHDNPLPLNIYQADANGSCSINGLDVTYYVSYLKGGPDLIEEDCE